LLNVRMNELAKMRIENSKRKRMQREARERQEAIRNRTPMANIKRRK